MKSDVGDVIACSFSAQECYQLPIAREPSTHVPAGVSAMPSCTRWDDHETSSYERKRGTHLEDFAFVRIGQILVLDAHLGNGIRQEFQRVMQAYSQFVWREISFGTVRAVVWSR